MRETGAFLDGSCPIFVGTSGWTYRDWKDRFYPASLSQRDWLRYYAERFATVELNVTTYRLPKQTDLERWSVVPQGFRYSVKLSRLLTHRRQPGQPQIFVDRFFASIEQFASRVANILAQFPPFFTRDDAALVGFLDALPAGHRYVLEFRHASWYCEPVYRILRSRNVSLCVHDLAGAISPLITTGPVLYVRLHGPVRAYVGSYRRARLEKWADTIDALSTGVDETFVYFNNDQRGFAPRNAATLRDVLAERDLARAAATP